MTEKLQGKSDMLADKPVKMTLFSTTNPRLITLGLYLSLYSENLLNLMYGMAQTLIVELEPWHILKSPIVEPQPWRVSKSLTVASELQHSARSDC
jgi:hypothetical protein